MFLKMFWILFLFLKKHHEHQILDLGQAWKDLTGLPFVFAVWAIRRDQSNSELRQVLMKAKKKGTGNGRSRDGSRNKSTRITF